MNPLQRAVKALSDVFIEIMPGILAAALLTGLSSVLGNIDFVQNNETLYGPVSYTHLDPDPIFEGEWIQLCGGHAALRVSQR